jgi:type IV fimbrial biogenesis protein FimT
MLIDSLKLKGFSLIELVVALAVVALLFTLAAPSFRTWMQNTQIRSAAQAITNGMSVARGEAIHRNVNVQFTLSSASDGTAASWQVALVSAPTVPLQSWSSAEGATSAQLVQAGGGIVTFNGLGRVISSNPFDGSAPLLQVDVTSSNDASDAALRKMRVEVGTGGMARMCDPLIAQPDPRAC